MNMKDDTKMAIIVSVLFIVGIPSVIFFFYLFFGFLDWIGDDPLNIINPILPVPVEETEPWKKCLADGGIPIKSGWNSQLKHCQFQDK